ncbi:uncharacterized protein LOC110886058 isoform X1 [Helianthus annuus]|uniref:uncharacterized protein LOC110886058 isoform X1 n=1 Tax=Helianthus annuus TaxID=4232 RepID=UPI000B904930|nr:uncharacterized protein LOC110886058 isoform X1 [Helianthus annuus]
MEDKGRKAQVKEGSSVLKRPRDEEEEEDLPNSAAASSATASASGTKTEVKAKRLSLDPPKPVTAGRRTFNPSVETSWTWVPFKQLPYDDPEPEVDEEEEEEIDEPYCMYHMVGGHLVLTGILPKSRFD